MAFLVGTKATPLSLTSCKHASRGDKIKLLPSDAELSSTEDLLHEDGHLYFRGCNHHRALYESQAAKRTCAFEGCDREVKVSKNGLRLCKLHGAKEDKGRHNQSPNLWQKLVGRLPLLARQGTRARLACSEDAS